MKGYGHAYIGPFNPALCHAASLFTQHWDVGLASPGCLNAEWPNLPPITPPSRVLFTLLKFFRWAHVAIISGKELKSHAVVLIKFVCCFLCIFSVHTESETLTLLLWKIYSGVTNKKVEAECKHKVVHIKSHYLFQGLELVVFSVPWLKSFLY